MILDFCGFKVEGTPDEILDLIEQSAIPRDKRKKQEAAVPEPERQPKQPKAKPKNCKDLDVGKIKALRDAGWTLEKIADEMHCSAQTVANKLKTMEVQNESDH